MTSASVALRIGRAANTRDRDPHRARCATRAGDVASWWLTRLLTGLLYEVTPTDPLTFTSAAAMLMGMAVAATAVPAWCATHVDSIIALRE
jgi:hypothetical protein